MPAALTPAEDDRSVDRSRRRGWIASAAITALALAVVLVLVIVTAGRGRDGFDTATTGQLVAAFRSQGLIICSTERSAAAHEDGALTTDVLRLARPGACGDGLDLQLDAYRSRNARDAAARAAEGVDRSRTAGTVWTWKQYTIYLQGDEASGEPDVRDRIVDALDAVGAA